MSRARNIKPGFFKNEILADLPFEFRLLFVGLWTHADREGRFEYRPRRIKAELFPYDEISVEDGIAALVDGGFLFIYGIDGKEFVQVLKWGKHQNPHHKEVGSLIPAPPGHVDRVCEGYIPLSNTIRRRIYARDGQTCKECGAKHGLSIDHIVPISKGGNSTDDNLQVLCLGCNVRKSNKISTTPNDKAMHEPCMSHASIKQIAPCPTDSGFLIPDSLIPDSLIPVPAQPAPTATRTKARKVPIPADFGISERVAKWAAEKGHTRIPERLEQFIGAAKARAYEYADWDEAFMAAVRDDWAKFGKSDSAIDKPGGGRRAL